MINAPDSLMTDAHGKELTKDGLPLFDLSANDGDIHQFAAGSIPSHWHKELEVFVLLDGCVQIGIGDCIYRLQAGEGCFINGEVIHSFTADTGSPCLYRSFVFGPELVGGMPGSIFDTVYVRPLLENGVPFLKFQEKAGDGVYFREFEQAFAACAGEEYGYEFRVREALSNILLYVKAKNRTAAKRSVPSMQEARLKAMLVWIEENLEKNIAVSEIAAAANICPRECQRIFNQYLHYSPIGYVQRKRIFAGAEQLAETEAPMTEIALNCGFSDPSYFSRKFKELMGSTPGEYRRAVKSKRQ